MNKPSGIIAIIHDVLENISDAEVMHALPDEWLGVPLHFVRISPIRLTQKNYRDVYWPRVFAAQEKQYKTQLKPLLEKHPDYEVLYFGRTTIGLAMHLGHQLASWKKVHVRQANHDSKDWSWPQADAGKPLSVGLPEKKFNAPGEVIVRVSTSLTIDPKDTLPQVADPLCELELNAPQPGRTIWGSPEQLDAYAGAFREMLDRIHDNLPGVDTVHLFAAIPVGLAFRMGQEVSPTTHPRVELYEYSGNATPPYEPVFVLNAALDGERFLLTPKEAEKLTQLRAALNDHVETELSHLANRIAEEPAESNWFEALFPDGDMPVFSQNQWGHLPRWNDCTRDRSFFEESAEQSRLGFHNSYLKALCQALPTKADQDRAARLACLHQSAMSAHKIRVERARALNGYPSILHEAEYQADVYALLHEFEHSRCSRTEAVRDMSKLLHVLIETLWAFEKLQSPDVLEAARLVRYLTLCFHLEWLRAHPQLGWQEVIAMLGSKPVIQLRATAKTDGKTQLFDLKTSRPKDCGLALLHNNRVALREQEDDMQQLLTGFQKRDTAAIRNVIASLMDEL